MNLNELKNKAPETLADKKLEPKQIEEYLKELGNWGVDEEGRLISNFEFDNFNEAVDFLNVVAKLAEEQNHHPDLMIYQYKNLLVLLHTHDADGLTEKDIAMAAKIEDLLLIK